MTRPIVPWPHMPIGPTLLKKITPAAQLASSGSYSSAPTKTSDPLGSLTTPDRKRLYSVRKRSRRCATLPTPRSGPPSITTRVGSPAVWESTTRTCFTPTAPNPPLIFVHRPAPAKWIRYNILPRSDSRGDSIQGVPTLENWEQRRAKPNGQAALPINLVKRFPDTVASDLTTLQS